MLGGYSTTIKERNAYDPRWFVPRVGNGSEGQWFHVTACKMNHTNDECADLHLIVGEARVS
jgi:hypothetical protein